MPQMDRTEEAIPGLVSGITRSVFKFPGIMLLRGGFHISHGSRVKFTTTVTAYMSPAVKLCIAH